MAKASRQRLRKLKIDNPTWGDLNGAIFFVTPALHKKLLARPKRDGLSFIVRLEKGRAVRGLKHLLERIRAANANAMLILTEGATTCRGKDFFVNLAKYTGHGQGRFLSVYRQAGLDVAATFLQSSFPNRFSFGDDKLSPRELRKARQNPDVVLEELSRREAQKRRLLRKTADVVRSLRDEKAQLKRSVAELEELKRQSSVAFYQERLAELKARLTKTYPETKGNKSWQAWIYANNWIMGVQYQRPFEKQKVGFDSIPDYLFPTLDGFIDILEIKKPEYEVIRQDASHPGSYSWSQECNRAIGQVTNYLYEMELNQLQLRNRINEKYKGVLESEIRVIRPRAFILIGCSDSWDSGMSDAFRKLNHTLHGIQVLTYSDLVNRGEHLIALYTTGDSSS